MKRQIAVVMFLSTSALLAQQSTVVDSERSLGGESSVAAPYEPLTISQRYKWAAFASVSPKGLAGNAISSAISTAGNSPEDYGPHWDGYGKRVGIRLATGATGALMEASVGAIWGEDPRYVRAAGQPFKNRLMHVAKMTFMARNRNGDFMPAYARYVSIPANSFMSNSFRADGEADTHHALIRIPMGFLSKAISNSFSEFWPDATDWMHRN